MFILKLKVAYSDLYDKFVTFDFNPAISSILVREPFSSKYISSILRNVFFDEEKFDESDGFQGDVDGLKISEITYTLFDEKSTINKPFLIKKILCGEDVGYYVNGKKLSYDGRDSKLISNLCNIIDGESILRFTKDAKSQDALIEKILFPSSILNKRNKISVKIVALKNELETVNDCLSQLKNRKKLLQSKMKIENNRRITISSNNNLLMRTIKIEELSNVINALINAKNSFINMMSEFAKKEKTIEEEIKSEKMKIEGLELFCHNADSCLKKVGWEIEDLNFKKRNTETEINIIDDELNILKTEENNINGVIKLEENRLDNIKKEIINVEARIIDLTSLLENYKKNLHELHEAHKDSILRKEKNAISMGLIERFSDFLKNFLKSKREKFFELETTDEEFNKKLISNFVISSQESMRLVENNKNFETINKKRLEVSDNFHKNIKILNEIESKIDMFKYDITIDSQRGIGTRMPEINHSSASVVEKKTEKIVCSIIRLIAIPSEYEKAIKSYLNYIISKIDGSIIYRELNINSEKNEKNLFYNLTYPIVNRGILSGVGIVGYLIDFVSFDKRYKNIMNHIFSESLLVTNLECAFFHREFLDCTIITLDGEVVTKDNVKNYFCTELDATHRDKIPYPIKHQNEVFANQHPQAKTQLSIFKSFFDEMKMYLKKFASFEEVRIKLQISVENITKVIFEKSKNIETLNIESTLINRSRELVEEYKIYNKKDFSYFTDEIYNLETENINCKKEVGNFERKICYNAIKMDRIKDELKGINNELINLRAREGELTHLEDSVKKMIYKKMEHIYFVQSGIKEKNKKILTLQSELKAIEISINKKRIDYSKNLSDVNLFRISLLNEKEGLETAKDDLNNTRIAKINIEKKLNKIEKEIKWHALSIAREKIEYIFEFGNDKLKIMKDYNKKISNIVSEMDRIEVKLKEKIGILEKKLASCEISSRVISNVILSKKERAINNNNIRFRNLLSQCSFAEKVDFNDIYTQQSSKGADGVNFVTIAILYLYLLHSYSKNPVIILDNIDSLFNDESICEFYEIIGKLSCFSQIILVTSNRDVLRFSPTSYSITIFNGHIEILSGIFSSKSSLIAA